MPKKEHKSTKKSYDLQQMLTRVSKKLESIDSKSVEHALEEAKDTAIKLGEISYEEGEFIIKSLKRDFSHLGKFLQQAKVSLSDWIKFDIEYLEGPVWEMLCQIADKTQLEQKQSQMDVALDCLYHAGETVLIGSFICQKCKEIQKLYHIQELSVCSNCDGKIFNRFT